MSASLHLLMTLPSPSDAGLKCAFCCDSHSHRYNSSWSDIVDHREYHNKLINYNMDDETLCTMNMFLAETKLLIEAVSIALMLHVLHQCLKIENSSLRTLCFVKC